VGLPQEGRSFFVAMREENRFAGSVSAMKSSAERIAPDRVIPQRGIVERRGRAAETAEQLVEVFPERRAVTRNRFNQSCRYAEAYGPIRRIHALNNCRDAS